MAAPTDAECLWRLRQVLPVLGGPSDPCGPLGPQIAALLTSLRHAVALVVQCLI